MIENQIISASRAQTTVRIILGVFFMFAGIGHLTFLRTEFLAQVPNWVPIEADTVVLLSGVVEIVLGVSLLFLVKKKITVGWIVSFFLVAVFPGNIAQLINHNYAFGLNSEFLLWLRLPFQLILITMVLWSTGALKAWRRKGK